MKARAVLLWALFVLGLFGPAAANAAITCTTITVTGGVNINYVSGGTVAQQQVFTATCSRSSTSDPTSINYDVTVDNGLNNNGTNNRAVLSGEYIKYDVYTTGCAGQKWKSPTKISDTITWSSGQTGAISKDTTFWACINTAQTPTTSGNHVDTVTMTLAYNPGSGNTSITGSMAVNIYAPATCSIPLGFGPSNITLNYTSFSASPVTSSTSFKTLCTVGMPYTLDVSPTTGTLAGVNYSVALDTTSTNGTGAQQTFNITASAIAGQAGTCTGASCNASQTHTLTISY